MGGAPVNYVAALIPTEESVELHYRLAQTMKVINLFDESLAEKEIDKAIAIGEKMGETEKLKRIYFESIRSLSSDGFSGCDSATLRLCEKYLALDASNPKAYAWLAVARLNHQNDLPGAIEAFKTSLTLEPRNNLVVRALLPILFENEDYDGVMKLLENEDESITSRRVRACLDEVGYYGCVTYQDYIMLSAKYTNKTDLLCKLYEREIARPLSKAPRPDDN